MSRTTRENSFEEEQLKEALVTADVDELEMLIQQNSLEPDAIVHNGQTMSTIILDVYKNQKRRYYFDSGRHKLVAKLRYLTEWGEMLESLLSILDLALKRYDVVMISFLLSELNINNLSVSDEQRDQIFQSGVVRESLELVRYALARCNSPAKYLPYQDILHRVRNRTLLRYLIKQGFDPLHCDTKGNTILHSLIKRTCAENELVLLVRYITQQGVSINQENNDQETVLHLLFENPTISPKKLFSLLLCFIQLGVNTKILLPKNQTLLHQVARKNVSDKEIKDQVTVFSLLLEKGLDPRAIDEVGESALTLVRHPDLIRVQLPFIRNTLPKVLSSRMLFNAVFSKDVELVNDLLRRGFRDTYQQKDGVTSLHVACIDGSERLITLLLLHTHHINTLSDFGAPLHCLLASLKHNDIMVGLVKKLLKKGAKINGVNKKGETPLKLAVARKDITLVRFFLEKKADPNLASPLVLAIKRNLFDIAKILIQFGAYYKRALSASEDQDSQKVTDLKIISYPLDHINDRFLRGQDILIEKTSSFVHYYLRRGATVQHPEKLLVFSARYNQLALAKYLVHQRGISVNCFYTEYGERYYPILEASLFHCREVLQFLLDEGASPNQVDKWGKTSLHYLVRHFAHDGDGEVIIQQLLTAEANVNKQDDLGNTPLMSDFVSHDSYNHIPELINLLSVFRIDFSIRNKEGNTLLDMVINYCFPNSSVVEVIQSILKNEGKLTECKASSQNIVMQIVTSHKQYAWMKELLKATQDVARRRLLGELSLYVATCNSDIETILEIKNAVDLKCFSNEFIEHMTEQKSYIPFGKEGITTPMELARYQQDKKVIRCLVNLGVTSDYYLWVGSGNMTLELAFARKHPNLAKAMIVTTYEPEEKMDKKGKHNKEKLKDLGVIVQHEVDATRLENEKSFAYKNITHIYFSHPHAGGKNNTASLVSAFFRSSGYVQISGSKVHLFRLRGGKKTCFPNSDSEESNKQRNHHYQSLYGLYKHSQYGYTLYKKHRFDVERYPDYEHKKTNKLTSAKNVTGSNSIEYVFKKSDIWNNPYNSSEISSDSESDSDYDALLFK